MASSLLSRRLSFWPPSGDFFDRGWLLYVAGVPLAVFALDMFGRDILRGFIGPARIGPALIGLFLCVLFVLTPSRMLLHNAYAIGQADARARHATSLLALAPLHKPIVVIADAYPLVAAMLARDPRQVVWTVDVPWLNVKTGSNTFHMYIQSWMEDEAVQAAEQLTRNDPAYLYVDPTVAPDAQRRLQKLGTFEVLNEP